MIVETKPVLSWAVSAFLLAAAGDRPGGALAVRGFASCGQRVGRSNIVAASVPAAPGWGPVEIYLGGSASVFGPDYWHALRYSLVRQAYENVFVSESMPAGLARLAVGDVTQDAGLEIVAALESGQILVYDQASKRVRRTFGTGLDSLSGLALSDLDGDGRAELVVTSSGSVRIFDGTGTLSWQIPGAGGSDVVVGQMDADPGLEIAVSSGAVVDVSSRTIQWNHSSEFGFELETADIDGDGMEELVAARRFSRFVDAYDVDAQLPKWSIQTESQIGAIRLAEVDADPALEVIVGANGFGPLFAFDTGTQEVEWLIPSLDDGVNHIATGDTDGDAAMELLWGTPHHLYVAGVDTRAIEWGSTRGGGPFVGPELGDIDGDGHLELVASSGRIFVLDPATFAVRAVYPPNPETGWSQVRDLKLRNVDDDPALEIVVATDALGDGVILIYDFDGQTATFAERWTNAERPHGSPFHSVEIADLDTDGDLEVIGGGGRQHTGAEGVFAYVFDLTSRELEWHTSQLGSYWSHVSAVKVLSGGRNPPELVALAAGESIYVFNGLTHAPRQIINGAFTALNHAYSPVGRSFLAGTAAGELLLYVRGLRAYDLASSLALGPPAIGGVHLVSKEGLVAVGQAGRLGLYRLSDGRLLWASANYGDRLGQALARDATYWYSGGDYAIVAFDPAVVVDNR